MSSIVTVVGLMLLSVLTYLKERKWYSPIFFLCAEWSLIVFFAEYGGIGYYPSSSSALSLIFLGVVCFVLGGLLVKKPKKTILKNNHENKVEVESLVESNKYLIYITLGFAMLYCVWKMSQIGLNVLRMQSAFAVYRLSWLNGGAFANAREEFIYNNIVLPSVYLNMIIGCIDFSRGKTKKIQAIPAMTCVALIVIFSGVRMILMDLAVMLVLAMTINKRSLSFKRLKKQRKYLIGALIILLLVINRISVDRQGLNLLQVAMGNFSLSLPLFSHTVDMVKSSGDMTYGLIFIRGITDFFLSILSFIGIDAWPQAYQTLSKYTTPFFTIGSNIRANAYTTSFFYFYLDARWIGVAFFSAIFGAFSQKLYLNVLSNQKAGIENHYNVALFLLGFSAVLRSFYNFSYSRLTYIIIILLIYFAVNPKRIHFKFKR